MVPGCPALVFELFKNNYGGHGRIQDWVLGSDVPKATMWERSGEDVPLPAD